jgi:radical SAM superfamily enzyme YgiQ (UPF0313 family)
MKTLLIQPLTPKGSYGYDKLYLDEPLALEYLGADIAPISDVKILDMRLDGNLVKELESFRPDIVGVTGYIIHVPAIKTICQQVKELQPEVLTMVGGQQATVSPEDFAHPNIDIIVIGDGVPTLREIVQKVEIGEDPREVRGTAFYQNARLSRTEARPLTNLDDFPFPDRSLTKPYRKYYHNERLESEAMFRTSRGCPHRCNFCTQWKLTRGRYLTRSVENIVKELQQIEEKSIFFVDDEAFLDANRMSRLADAIEAAGIKKKYLADVRSDTVLRNPELMRKWQGIGLDSLYMGFEFYDQEDLDYVGKGTSPEKNEQAIRLLQSLDIHIYPLFMVRPDYDEANFKAFARYVRRFNFDRMAQFSVLTPLPGSDLYEELKEQILDLDLEFFDCVHAVLPTKLPLKEFYGQLARLYRDSTPWQKYLSFLRTLPPTKVIGVAWLHRRLLSRLKNLYKEYPPGYQT